jgi:hypothetical protein
MGCTKPGNGMGRLTLVGTHEAYALAVVTQLMVDSLTVHGLTMLMIDDVADVPRSGIEAIAKRVATSWCDGLMRR